MFHNNLTRVNKLNNHTVVYNETNIDIGKLTTWYQEAKHILQNHLQTLSDKTKYYLVRDTSKLVIPLSNFKRVRVSLTGNKTS